MTARARTVSNLATHYEKLQRRIKVTEDATFAPLVVPNGNSSAPVHRWFHLKEGFSCDLPLSILDRLGLQNATDVRLIDPFVGVGTSLVSALGLATEGGRPRFTHLVGIERNPFLHLVASSKVRALVEERPPFQEFIASVHELNESNRIEPAEQPTLSTFANPDYFARETLRDLLRLKTAVELAEGDDLATDIARVCLAGCLEPVSNLRRDGRALRYEHRKVHPTVLEEFRRRTSTAAGDLSATPPVDCSVRVALGDGRTPASHVTDGTHFRLALFSPPYPNNIDYTEVYKLENWFLGFIGSQDEFRSQRLRTVRSHPSVAFDELYELSDNGYRLGVEKALKPLLEAVPADRYRHQRRRLVRGYFDDMLQTLRSLYDLLEDGGRLVYIVGNPAHGHGSNSFVVASDLIMARLATLVGFDVQELIVARYPSRRKLPSANAPSAFLRESVVILSK